LFPMRELALMGFLEVLPKLRRLQRRLAETEADIAARRPDLVITIDSPGFALRLLRAVAKLGIARIHYVAPQVWAWRESRVRHYPGVWDDLLCLLPFEPAFFARHGLPATFVGHPVLESGADRGDAARFRTAHGVADNAPVLTVLPGSRRTEVGRLLPVLGATIAQLAPQVPGLVPVVPVAATVSEIVRSGTVRWPVRPVIVTDDAGKHDAFAASTAALTKSGTSTLELGLAGVPMIVTYRVNSLSAAIARRLIKVRFASLLNLLAGAEIVPELLQAACTPERLAAALLPLLTSPAARDAQRAAFAPSLQALRPPSGTPSDAAAEAALVQLDKQSRRHTESRGELATKSQLR
ncbi:MAG: lipid-A-disaccharide synthase, partial [Acetobacteraceae bacterium]|nr:lipid-A-disaccharide synthase [Acetobacteraceae bacterium]